MTALFDRLHRAYIESRVEEWGLPPQDVETWLRSPGYRRDVEAIMRAVTAAGYTIVPVEPTPSIIGAVAAAAREPTGTMGDVSQRARAIWRDGLAAAQAKDGDTPA